MFSPPKLISESFIDMGGPYFRQKLNKLEFQSALHY